MIQMLDLRKEYEYMKREIDAAIRECLKHQQWILGPEVKQLEEAIAKYIGVKYCIGTSSGTDALVLSLRALALKMRNDEYFTREDEIITTPFTFTATGDAIIRAGATPVFIDVDEHTYNLDIVKVNKYLERYGNKVIGIVPVHLFGQGCNMTDLMMVAKKRRLFVVEDVAQAFGASWKDKKLGSYGVASAFSFFPSKNLGGYGDGGAVCTDDEEITDLVRMLTKHGGKDKYNVDHIGYNARLDTIQAAILLVKLKYVDEFNMRRRVIAKKYNAALKNVKDVMAPAALPDAYHIYHQYTIRVLDNKRDKLMNRLKEADIATAVYYPVALHQMNLFMNKCIAIYELKVAERLVREVLSLPIEPLLKDEEIKKIVSVIKAVS